MGSMVVNRTPESSGISAQERAARLTVKAQKRIEAGDWLGAIPMLERGRQLLPHDPWFRSALESCYRQGIAKERRPNRNKRWQTKLNALLEDTLGERGEHTQWFHGCERSRALNATAWRRHESGGTRDELRGALRDINEALVFSPYQLDAQDTKARLLLDLGETDKAYALLAWIQDTMIDFAGSQDLFVSPPFQRWRREHPEVQVPVGVEARPALEALDPAATSPATERLNRYERDRIARARKGEDEWHRARNAALVALLTSTDIPVRALTTADFAQADLSRGVFTLDGGAIPLSDSTLSALRHWYQLYVIHPEMRFGGRKRLFVNWALRPLTSRHVEEIVAEATEAAGLRHRPLQHVRPGRTSRRRRACRIAS